MTLVTIHIVCGFFYTKIYDKCGLVFTLGQYTYVTMCLFIHLSAKRQSERAGKDWLPVCNFVHQNTKICGFRLFIVLCY